MGKEGLSLEAPVDWPEGRGSASGKYMAWPGLALSAAFLPAEGGRSVISPPRFLLGRDREQWGVLGILLEIGRERG